VYLFLLLILFNTSACGEASELDGEGEAIKVVDDITINFRVEETNISSLKDLKGLAFFEYSGDDKEYMIQYNGMPDSIIVYDSDGLVVHEQAKLAAIFEEDLVQRQPSQDQDKLQRFLTGADNLGTGNYLIVYKVEFVTPDGDIFSVEAEAVEILIK